MNRLLCAFCFAYLLLDPVAAYDPLPRWGQATVVINDALFVHGGKTDQYNSYSYSSAPPNSDLLLLSLSSSFDISSPPWQLISNSSFYTPAVAWHTISAFNTSGILMFGGQPGPNSPTVLVDLSDSAGLLNVDNRLDPEWIPEVASWAGQPMRRIRHSTATAPSGLVFIIGGEMADGSNNPFSDHYIFEHAGPSFTLLPTGNGPPGVCGHASVILPDGRLLVFGGYSQPQGALLPFSTIFTLDTTKSSLSWSIIRTSDSSLPSPRRAFAVALLSDGKVLIHGGSDAVLQNNFDDGWILDTSQNPMVWAQVDALSSLGARREHFAVSSGDQVIFGFGYGSNTAAPAALQIFDVVNESFTSTFTPPPFSTQGQTLTNGPISTPTQTPSGSSQTLTGPSQASGYGTAQGGDPTVTTNPNPDGGNDGNSHSNRTTIIALGTVFGVLGVVLAVVVIYYIRRRNHQALGGRRFMALNGGDDGDGSEAGAPSTEGIPAAEFLDDPISHNEHGWGFGVLGTIGLASILRTGRRTVRHIPERRDMLADEDTRDFGEWYDARRRDGSGGSAWSLRSMLGARMRTREPSTSSNLGGGMMWREKSDPFSEESSLVQGAGADYAASAITAAVGPQGQTQDYIQVRRSYDDVEDNGAAPPQSTSSKDPSQKTLVATQDYLANSSPSNSPLPSTSSNMTSYLSPEQLLTHVPSPSSIIGSTPMPTRSIRRSDSWWARFSHTAFLDRRASDASRRSTGMLEFRDPNPRPQLIAIEESTHSSPDHEEQHSKLPSASQQLSGVFDRHNKSLTSLGTADTEVIEKMAGAMDVVQRFRTAHTRRTTDSTTSSADSASMTMDARSDPLGEEKDIRAADHEESMFITSSPVDIQYSRSLGRTSQDMQPSQSSIKSMTKISLPLSPSLGSSATSLASSHLLREGEGAVASRIREYERRMFLDQEVPNPTNTRKHEERQRKKGTNIGVDYGLVHRPSLFVANPDGRMTPSGD